MRNGLIRKAPALTLFLALLATSSMADENDRDPAVRKMLAEPLADTSPASLRTASFMLGKGFKRGADDMDGYVYLQKLLVMQALELAKQHPDKALEYTAAAVPMTYNLAANTWVGWGPERIGAIDENHQRLGMAAARKNVELAAQVGLGAERRRNGYWILGAHQLAAGDYDAAAESFATSAALGEESGDAASAAMAKGWVHVARILAGEDETAELAAITSQLRGLGKDGVFYADQYAVALDVFRARRVQQGAP